jgi:hypothetical protein
MRPILLTIGLLFAAPVVAGCPANLETCAGKPGDHPAIVARRVIAAQGYDYASKFYPHPAWLYLSATPMPDDPAVVVLRRAEQERRVAPNVPLQSLAER